MTATRWGIIIALLMWLLALPARADDARSRWFKSLMQPDNPSISCCGPADAYFAEVFSDGGKMMARVVGKPRVENPLPVGYVVEIPRGKFNRDANIFDQPVVFLSPAGHVYCVISGSGV